MGRDRGNRLSRKGGTSAFGLDLGDQRLRFLSGAVIVNQDVCPGFGKRRCRRAANSS